MAEYDRMDEFMDEVDEDLERTKPAGGGGGGSKNMPLWKQRQMHVRFNEDPVWVQLFPGDYDGSEFHKSYSTWLTNKNNQKRQVFCRCDAEKRKIPCALCYYRRKEENPDFRARVKIHANAIILEEFHWVERSNDKGKTWKEPVLCQGTDRLGRPQCEYCDKGLKKSFGLRRYLALGPGYWKDFKKVIHKVRTVCKSCNGTLMANKYVCRKCNSLFVDLNKSTVPAKRRKHFEEEQVACPNCGEVARAKPVYGCYKIDPDDSDNIESGCDKPEPCTVFDMPIRLKAVSDSQSSSLVCVNKESQWKHTPMDPKIAELAEPWDFPTIFGTTLAEQCEQLGRPNPYKEDGSLQDNPEDDVDPYKDE